MKNNKKSKISLSRIGRGRKAVCLLIAYILLFMVGCGNTPTLGEDGNTQNNGDLEESGQQGENGDKSRAMGRFVESSQDLSELLRRPSNMVQMQDGSIVIQDYDEGQVVSKDNGKTWEKVKKKWLSDLQKTQYIHSMTLGNNGYTAVWYTPLNEDEISAANEEHYSEGVPESEDEQESEEAAKQEEDSVGETMLWDYALVDPQGNLIPVAYPDKEAFTNQYFSDKGELFIVDYSNNRIYLVDEESHEAQLYLETEEEPRYLNFSGDYMVIGGAKSFTFYNRNTQEWIEDEVLNEFIQANHGSLEYYDMDQHSFLSFLEGEIIYFAFNKGLYRHSIGGSVIEQVIDGGLSTFSDPSLSLVSMIALDDHEFLTLFTGGKLLRYTYDANMSTVPDQQLKVYSLEENDVLRMAIVNFQANFPEVYVKFEVGMDSSSGVTREDAIKKLNTEIMAGSGPDFMILDEMPIRSYKDKGILADLTPYLEELEQEEELLPIIRDTFKEQEVVYGIPALFSVPTLMGEKNTLNRINDLKTLADEVESIRKINPEGGIMGIYTERQILIGLSMVYGAIWQNDEGIIEHEEILDYFTQAKRIYDAEISGISQDKIDEYKEESAQWANEDGRFTDPDVTRFLYGGNTINVAMGDDKMSMAFIQDGFTLALMISAIENEPDRGLDFKGINSEKGISYIPSTIVGISASSTNQELAGKLLNVLLSEEILKKSSDGYPVNKAAYEGKFINTYNLEGEREIGSVGFGTSEGISYSLEVYWPLDKDLDKFKDIINAADVADLTESTVKDTVIEIGEKVLKGNITPQQGVDEVMNRLTIYMAE